MDLDDKSTSVRHGEELNLQGVEEFLRANIEGLEGTLTVEQFPSGYSNLTYLLRMSDRELVLRRPPFGRKAKTAHDMGREFRILRSIEDVFPYSPRALLYCDDESITGSPFYVMDRIKGIILRRDLPQGMAIQASQMEELCENLVNVHHELHSIDFNAQGLTGLGKPEGYVRRQVEGWSNRYRSARTEDAPSFEVVMKWLAENMPHDSVAPALIHNDYKFDNVVLDPANGLRIKGVLDWEMATIGDPLMDLGCSLAYWVQENDPDILKAIRTLPTNLPGAWSRIRIVERYAQKSGLRLDDFSFYYCFGLFRLAVIAQQIYYRYYHGQTGDPRFKALIGAVHGLDSVATMVTRGQGL